MYYRAWSLQELNSVNMQKNLAHTDDKTLLSSEMRP